MSLTTRSLIVLLLCCPVAARADVVVGPYTFTDAALIDDVVQVEGTAWDQWENGHINGTDSHWFPYTFSQLFTVKWDDIVYLGATDITSEMVFEAHFTDNRVVNEPGPDLVLFDAALWGDNAYDVAIGTDNGFTEFRTHTSPIGAGDSFAVWWWTNRGAMLIWVTAYAFEIDLSDFGLEDGSTVSAFRFKGHNGADPMGAAAIHSAVPTPTKQTTWGAVKALYR
jgi:hypothetical protein